MSTTTLHHSVWAWVCVYCMCMGVHKLPAVLSHLSWVLESARAVSLLNPEPSPQPILCSYDCVWCRCIRITSFTYYSAVDGQPGWLSISATVPQLTQMPRVLSWIHSCLEAGLFQLGYMVILFLGLWKRWIHLLWSNSYQDSSPWFSPEFILCFLNAGLYEVK